MAEYALQFSKPVKSNNN